MRKEQFPEWPYIRWFDDEWYYGAFTANEWTVFISHYLWHSHGGKQNYIDPSTTGALCSKDWRCTKCKKKPPDEFILLTKLIHADL